MGGKEWNRLAWQNGANGFLPKLITAELVRTTTAEMFQKILIWDENDHDLSGLRQVNLL
ncbi:hypothetical protein ACTQ6A_00610 [Lachnospiraceae bacterium LCP25S3_G4]